MNAEPPASLSAAPEPASRRKPITDFQKAVLVINLAGVTAGIVLSMLVAFDVLQSKDAAFYICALTAVWGFGTLRAARLF